MKKMFVFLGIMGIFLTGCSSSISSSSSSTTQSTQSSNETSTTTKAAITITNEKQFGKQLKKLIKKMKPIQNTMQGFVDDPSTYTAANIAKMQLKLTDIDALQTAVNSYVEENGETFDDEKVTELYQTYREKLIDMVDVFGKLPDEIAD